jgi:hypothetical protein
MSPCDRVIPTYIDNMISSTHASCDRGQSAAPTHAPPGTALVRTASRITYVPPLGRAGAQVAASGMKNNGGTLCIEYILRAPLGASANYQLSIPGMLGQKCQPIHPARTTTQPAERCRCLVPVLANTLHGVAGGCPHTCHAHEQQQPPIKRLPHTSMDKPSYSYKHRPKHLRLPAEEPPYLVPHPRLSSVGRGNTRKAESTCRCWGAPNSVHRCMGRFQLQAQLHPLW